MGAWGHGPFENDDALDWVAGLRDAKSWSIVENAFAGIAAEDVDYLEAPECSVAIAACEVVAAALGKPCAELPEEARLWVNRANAPDDRIRRIAVQALDTIRKDSELKELWNETDEASAWEATILDLRSRLIDGPAHRNSIRKAWWKFW